MPPQLSNIDYAVIVFYFVFMASIGWVFKRFNKNTSDYFRSGGEVLWWIVGAGAFMTAFSAVTFTGMAGKAYTDGPVVLIIFIGNAIGFFFNYLYFAPVFRQLRCVTAMQAVRNRFGAVNEQFFTWLQIPTGLMYAAIWLNGLGVFTAAAFGWSLGWTIIITGAVVVFITVIGGNWSSTASDFVQLLLLMPITVVAAVFALTQVGGIGQFIERAPTKFWNWSESAHLNIILLWTLAMLLQKFVSCNTMTDAARYLSVKDTKHARRAAMLATVMFVIGSAVWFIPPMVSRILQPELKGMFPNLQNPQDASYFAIASITMPNGMLGVLLSAIFAATMSSMDSGLNKNAGYFVKNFYQVALRPRATERELVAASMISTLVFGILIILIGLVFASWQDLPIFNLMVNFGGWVALPISVPLVWGMFIRRAPSWAGWSTVLVGLGTSYLTNRFLNAAWAGELFGFDLNRREASDWAQLAGILMNIVAGSTWFLLTPLMQRQRSPGEVQRVNEFFTQMHTPVDFDREEGGGGSDNLQARVMGLLCVVYGGFITLLVVVPNPLRGRVAYLFCGGCMFVVGVMLYRAGRRKAALETAGGSAPPSGEALAREAQPPARGFQVIADVPKETVR
jgi:solute:Na+ symporter, SSS family